ncbi:COX assembly mitochondrial protein homolog [Prionailurus bengalensis]|uniref:COX assembly mitochondrial protein homolog n=1 Tax=Prionailurus bengalensis TaxID=37029 RepID=UPI001CA8C9DB|nr:COX assembly mitochondrial protein homolog [Prionailurus bengalensis]
MKYDSAWCSRDGENVWVECKIYGSQKEGMQKDKKERDKQTGARQRQKLWLALSVGQRFSKGSPGFSFIGITCEQALKRKTCWAETHFPNRLDCGCFFCQLTRLKQQQGRRDCRRERREGFGRELSRHGRRSPKGQQLRLGSPQTRVCKRALALRPKLRGGARRAQAQCAAEVATREIRRKGRGLSAGLREGHCAPPPWLPPPQGSSGRPHVPPSPGSSPSLPLPGSGRGLLSSPPAAMALDPAEQHLRHVEKDVLIPKIMREKARERCSEQVQDLSKTPEKVHLRFYQMLQGLWNPYGSKMPKRKFCIERMSNCSL